jgi:hypothetical protein
VIVGKDQTIHAKVEGYVHFRKTFERNKPDYIIDVINKYIPNKKSVPPRPYNYHPELFPERAPFNHPQIVKKDKYHAKIQE